MRIQKPVGNLNIFIVAVLVALVGFGGWYLGNSTLFGNKTDIASVEEKVKAGNEVILNESELRALAVKYPPLYYAGPRDGTKYGVSVTSNKIFVRYIPNNDNAGSTKQYLTVVTYYAAPEAYKILSTAKTEEATVAKVQSGAVVVTYNKTPHSTYFAFPNGEFQVEVFSPEDGQASKLINNGNIQLVDKSK